MTLILAGSQAKNLVLETSHTVILVSNVKVKGKRSLYWPGKVLRVPGG
jgi:hypothetical protein